MNFNSINFSDSSVSKQVWENFYILYDTEKSDRQATTTAQKNEVFH